MTILIIVALVAVIAASGIVLTDPCTITALRTDSKCFDALSKTEKRALMAYLLGLALEAESKATFDPTAFLKSTVCMSAEPDFVLDSFMVLLCSRLASGLGASVPATIADARAAIKCIAGADPKLVRVAIVQLLCQLVDDLAKPVLL